MAKGAPRRKNAALAAFDRAAGDWSDDPADRLTLEECDMDNAERLFRVFGRDMLYVTGKGWGVWTGPRFDFQNGQTLAHGIALRLRELVKAEAAAARHAPVSDLEAQRELERERAKPPRSGMRFADLDGARDHLRLVRRQEREEWATACGNAAKIAAALELLRPRCLAPLDSLDADPWRIAAPNGVIDLRAACAPLPDPSAFADEAEHHAASLAARRAWLSQPDRNLRNTRTLGVDYDAAADCPRFRAFIELIEPDAAGRGYLQRALGATLHGANWLQAALLLRGSGGNGKSTLLAILSHVMGGYAAPCRIEMFLDGRDERAGQATPEEVDLPGARVMIASEPGARDVLSGKRIKSMTGGDPRPARALGQAQFIYTPNALPVLSFNRTPQIKDEDEGLWRRLEFVLFNVELHLLPEHQRRDMGEVLEELKAEGPGILNWLLDGYAAARHLGRLHPPPAVVRFKEELRGASDPVGEFLAACVEDAPGEHIASRDLHEVFTAWCGENGARAFSLQAFGKLLAEKGLKSGTRRKAKHWLHKRLHPDAPSPVAAANSGPPWRDDA